MIQPILVQIINYYYNVFSIGGLSVELITVELLFYELMGPGVFVRLKHPQIIQHIGIYIAVIKL